MTLRDIWFVLEHYDVGSWFALSDDFWSGKGIPRPFVLATEWTGGPLAQLYPRSTRPFGSDARIPHEAHRAEHEPRCAVTVPGWIVLQRLSVPADRLKG